jgi:hypothetical protein
MEPTTNGGNGRNANGKFAKGNPGGPGNPYNRRVARLRSAAIKAVTPDDISKVIATLLEAAKGGDVAAIRELLDRTIGKPSSIVSGADGGPIQIQAATNRRVFDSAAFIELLRQQLPEPRALPSIDDNSPHHLSGGA